jgi:hypothetical protein
MKSWVWSCPTELTGDTKRVKPSQKRKLAVLLDIGLAVQLSLQLPNVPMGAPSAVKLEGKWYETQSRHGRYSAFQDA